MKCLVKSIQALILVFIAPALAPNGFSQTNGFSIPASGSFSLNPADGAGGGNGGDFGTQSVTYDAVDHTLRQAGFVALDNSGDKYPGYFNGAVQIDGSSSLAAGGQRDLSGADGESSLQGLFSSGVEKVTADNGFDLSADSGAGKNFDALQTFDSNSPDTVVANLVPEPPNWELFSAGAFLLFGLLAAGKRKSSLI